MPMGRASETQDAFAATPVPSRWDGAQTRSPSRAQLAKPNPSEARTNGRFRSASRTRAPNETSGSPVVPAPPGRDPEAPGSFTGGNPRSSGRSRAKHQSTAAPSSRRSTGRRSTHRQDSQAITSAAVVYVRTDERPAAPLSTPYARPRSLGAHHAAMSRLAGAKPIDCAQPFKAHGIASVQKPCAKLPSQLSAQEATAPR